MPKVIGAKLRLEAVLSLALRTRHHARIRDDHVEGLAARQQIVRRFAHAFERCEVRLDQIDRRAPRRECFIYSALRLAQIASSADDGRAMCGERARSLNAQA